MKHLNLSTNFMGSILIWLLFAACSAPQATPSPPQVSPTLTSTLTSTVSPTITPTAAPTQTPTAAPTITPVESVGELDLLTFGDSRTAWSKWPDVFAGYVEEDLNTDVNLNNSALGGQTSEELLDWLRNREQIINLLREAEIVILLTIDDFGMRMFANYLFDPTDTCSTDEYEIVLEDILMEILELRRNNPPLIRLIEHYNFPGPEWADNLDVRKDCFERYNESLHAVAEKHGIVVVPVYEAFNGPDGEDNPENKGYLVDGVHLSNEGGAAFADLIRELGYDPIFP